MEVGVEEEEEDEQEEEKEQEKEVEEEEEECSYMRRRRFNCNRVLVLNDPPALQKHASAVVDCASELISVVSAMGHEVHASCPLLGAYN